MASARTASVSPRPNIRITEVLAAINAANEIDMISASANYYENQLAYHGSNYAGAYIWLICSL